MSQNPFLPVPKFLTPSVCRMELQEFQHLTGFMQATGFMTKVVPTYSRLIHIFNLCQLDIMAIQMLFLPECNSSGLVILFGKSPSITCPFKYCPQVVLMRVWFFIIQDSLFLSGGLLLFLVYGQNIKFLSPHISMNLSGQESLSRVNSR